MDKKVVFMAGLPRSGSTLLGALLGQNPRIHTEPASPLMEMIVAINGSLERNEHYHAYPKPTALYGLIGGLFDSYYSHTSKPVIVDKNRGWPTQIAGLEQCVTDQVKIICPVRNIDQIVASFLKLAKDNPYDPATGRTNFVDRHLIANNKPVNDENRCQTILSSKGLLGSSMAAIKQAIEKGYGDRLYFVEYGDLMTKPSETLKGIYRFIDEEPYDWHDFDNIVRSDTELDSEVFGVPEMHVVRKELSASSTNSKELLPPDVYKQCKGSEFWRAKPAPVASE